MNLSSLTRVFVSAALLSCGCSAEAGDGAASSSSQGLQETARAEVVIDFTGCVESIGVEVVPTATVRPRVPAGFTLAGEGAPVTPIVLRTAHCDRIALSRSFPEVEGAANETARHPSVSIVQVGAIVAPPDGTGDVNVYTLSYHTDSLRLFAALRYAGLVAELAAVDYDYRPQASRLDVRLLGLHDRFALGGSVGTLGAPPVPFVSNWWTRTAKGPGKLSTTVPALVIGAADLSLQTVTGTDLAALLGSTGTPFSVFEQFNGFSTARSRI